MALLSIVLLPLASGNSSAFSAAEVQSGWEEQSSGTSAFLTGVSAVDALDVWAVGHGVVLHTTDGGKTWKKVYEKASTHFTDVCAADKNNIWFVGREGDPGTGVNFISKTEDGGATWRVQYTAAEPYAINAISAAGPQVAWAVGAKGIILKTDDGGRTWVSQVSGTPKELTSVCAVDANTAWAAGMSESWNWYPGIYLLYPPFVGAPYYPIILRTQDGGANWQAMQTGTYSEGFDDIAGIDSLHAMAVGMDYIYSPIPMLAYDYYSSTVYLALNYSDIYTAIATHNGGIVWMKVPDVASYAKEVEMVDANTAWVVSFSGGSRIYKTSDGGLSVREQHVTDNTKMVEDIDAVDSLHAWAVGSGGLILHTSNGGDSVPDLVSITPTSGTAGSVVTLTGCDFGAERGTSYVSFGNVQASEYLSWSDKEIEVKVPEGVTGTVQVTVTTAQGTSNGVSFTSSAFVFPCGTGSATALPALGLALGMLSLAGAVGRRTKRRSLA